MTSDSLRPQGPCQDGQHEFVAMRDYVLRGDDEPMSSEMLEAFGDLRCICQKCGFWEVTVQVDEHAHPDE